MDQRKIPWKAEWKASGLDPGPLTPEEADLVPRLQAENQEFLRAHPYSPRAKTPPVTRLMGALGVPLALVAAALLVVAGPLTGGPSLVGPNEHMKGPSTPRLFLYRNHDGKPEPLAERSVVRSGDVLQAAYLVTQPTQGAVLSVDGDRNVTVHLAVQGRSAPLASGGEHPLEFSYELDQAPLYEVFVLVTSATPFDVEPIRQRLKTTPWNGLAPGAFGAGLNFTVFPLVKGNDR